MYLKINYKKRQKHPTKSKKKKKKKRYISIILKWRWASLQKLPVFKSLRYYTVFSVFWMVTRLFCLKKIRQFLRINSKFIKMCNSGKVAKYFLKRILVLCFSFFAKTFFARHFLRLLSLLNICLKNNLKKNSWELFLVILNVNNIFFN